MMVTFLARLREEQLRQAKESRRSLHDAEQQARVARYFAEPQATVAAAELRRAQIEAAWAQHILTDTGA
ncbi:gas vesicle protein GvpC [Roseibium salinum]|uniref:Gas vesicle protein C n=1 Tax=Roseibium salinum TaxID=1604349 RepID=A0ABT3QYG9_9HYPH|nr:gas vesicle protein GvpC [Roseibium sp. DSM 29163]MCX2721964.1 gas vesicle protein GvpC [Roseibium sp. DSM 29163]